MNIQSILRKIFDERSKNVAKPGFTETFRMGNEDHYLEQSHRKVPVQIGEHIFYQDVLHSDDGPALRCQFSDGRFIEIYMKDGMLCRSPDGGPAIQGRFEPDGNGRFDSHVDSETLYISADSPISFSGIKITEPPENWPEVPKEFLQKAPKGHKRRKKPRTCSHCGSLNP